MSDNLLENLTDLEPSQAQPEVIINANNVILRDFGASVADGVSGSISVKEIGHSPAGDAINVTALHFDGATVTPQTNGVALITITPSSDSGGGGGTRSDTGTSLEVTDGSTIITSARSIRFPSGTLSEGSDSEAIYTPAGGGGSGGGGTALLPATLPGLIYWFDASQVATPAGSSVPLLGSPDQTRAPFTMYSAGGGAVVGATELNGLPVLTFSGTSAGNYVPSYTVPLPQSTVFVVVKPASFANYQSFVTGVPNSLDVQIAQTTGHLNITNTNTALVATSAGPLTAGSWGQFNIAYSSTGGAYSFRIGRAADSSGTATASMANAITGLFFNVNGGENMDADVAEMIVYNSVLTLTQIESVETYLHSKWGV